MGALSIRRIHPRLAACGLLCVAALACDRSRQVAESGRVEVPPAPARIVLAPQDPPVGPPSAVVDLMTEEGVALVRGAWKYRDVDIVRAEGREVGPDLRPSGRLMSTLDYEPKAGVAGFDDSSWPTIEPGSLQARRSTGKLCFAWYRIVLEIPEDVARFSTIGSTVAFEIVVDDYAEVWVNGSLGLRLGDTSGSVVSGFNAPNRVILGEGVKPGDRFEIAVFAMNGPISASPDNFIWVRSATLDFYPATDSAEVRSYGTLVRHDPAIDAIFPPAVKVEKLAGGFEFVEGPVWAEGTLLFSDPNNNVIYRYDPRRKLTIFRTKSGYSGTDIGEYHQPGSNGLTLDHEGHLVICEHGNRRIRRLERNGSLTVLADRFGGQRLNSPNDLVYRSDGTLYFTDPPYGLPGVFDDPRKELPFSGVFRLTKEGEVQLIDDTLQGPNGVAFSPDEDYLYVTNWDLSRKIIKRYQVRADGSTDTGTVFFDMTGSPGEEALDGLKVDRLGNLYVSGPGGVWIVSPEAKHLGTLVVDELPANMAWGDTDGKTLYMTARTGLYRVRLLVPGIRPNG